MVMENVSVINENRRNGKSSSLKYLVLVCLLLAALIIGRAANDMMFYIFAAISAIIITASNVANGFCLLLFLLPSSSILKAGVGQISFFTILFLIVVVKMFFTRKKYSAGVLISVILMAVYALAVSGTDQLVTVATMALGLVMVYSLRTVNINANDAVFSFSMGITLASVIALLKETFPIVSEFIEETTIKLDVEEYATRFSGLHGNPNYYTLDIIIVLSAIIVLMYYKKGIKIHTISMIALSVFGLMSISKSFLLSWIILVFIWLVLSVKQGVGKIFKFLVIGVIAVSCIYLFAYEYINTYLFRFAEDSGSGLDSLTTGRLDLWIDYIEAILGDVKIMLFGNGLNTLIEGKLGAHNTFIESAFCLGLLGSALFVSTIRICTGKIVVKPVMWIPVFLLLFRMTAINTLTYDNLWFYIALMVVLAKDILEKSELVKIENEEN